MSNVREIACGGNPFNLIKLIICITCCLFLSSCLMLNDTRPLSDKFSLPNNPERAVIVFGLKFEGDLGEKKYMVSLDEYDMDKQEITGGCWRYNHVKGEVRSPAAGIQYFAFDVRPGYYVFSAFNGGNSFLPLGKAHSYFIPAGTASYVGDFVYSKSTRMTAVQKNISQAEVFAKKNYPLLGGNLRSAVSIETAAPSMFLCAP